MIWIFGDSFFNCIPEHTNTWHQQLGPVKNCALEATSLDWMYAEYSRHEGSFTQGDTVIVGLTTLDRTWFFADNPQASQVFRGHAPNTITQQQVEAVMLYSEFLMNPFPRMVHLENFLARLDHTAQHLTVKILVIASFPDSLQIISDLNLAARYQHVTLAQGTLMQASLDEWATPPSTMKDPRSNHLSQVNHDRLAELITQWMQNPMPVILTEFHTNILNPEKFIA